MMETVNSLRQKTKAEFIQILHWEDDGGAVYDIDTPLPQVAETNTSRSMNVATDDLFYAGLKKQSLKRRQKINPFVSYMASNTGRIIRIVAGLALVVWGRFGLSGMTALVVALTGIVPLFAGIFDFCVFAPLFGAPLSGAKIRAGK
jgi:hypothetical protein